MSQIRPHHAAPTLTCLMHPDTNDPLTSVWLRADMGWAIPPRFFLSGVVIQRLIFWCGYKRSGKAHERKETKT